MEFEVVFVGWVSPQGVTQHNTYGTRVRMLGYAIKPLTQPTKAIPRFMDSIWAKNWRLRSLPEGEGDSVSLREFHVKTQLATENTEFT